MDLSGLLEDAIRCGKFVVINHDMRPRISRSIAMHCSSPASLLPHPTPATRTASRAWCCNRRLQYIHFLVLFDPYKTFPVHEYSVHINIMQPRV